MFEETKEQVAKLVRLFDLFFDGGMDRFEVK